MTPLRHDEIEHAPLKVTAKSNRMSGGPVTAPLYVVAESKTALLSCRGITHTVQSAGSRALSSNPAT
eukprot:589708-Rhodomonas_salina.1